MTVSQNGWTANDRSVIVSYPLPGGQIALRRGPAGQVLAYVGRRWHAEVEPLLWPGCWGYAERPIRGGVQLSNHASGTAADWCAPRHPLGTNPATNFSGAQIAAVHRIIAACGGLIRWGGDYVGRKDGMHVEVNDGITEAQLSALWARLSGTPAPPAPVSSAVAAVAALQQALHFVGPEVDGVWGPQTDAGFDVIRHAINGQFDLPGGVREAQTRVGAPVADGSWGPASRAALTATVARLQYVMNDAPADGVWRASTQAAYEHNRAAYHR